MSAARPAPSRRVAGLVLAGLVAGAAAVGCGASIHAVYEGDVRFEHCMALDSRSDVKPTLRGACWGEWLRYYTFGQTRDRVEYARARARQLGGSSDFDEGEWSPPARAAAAAVPEPTSALAPPPMLLAVDAGPPADAAPAPVDAAAVDPAPPGVACADECDEGWRGCVKECQAPACARSCASKHKRCVLRCY
jgi:hypothetical protein